MGRLVSGDDELSWVAQTDFGYFGPPEEHFQWTQEEREATYITADDPSSEICGEVAAALAASSLALRDTGNPPLAHSDPRQPNPTIKVQHMVLRL